MRDLVAETERIHWNEWLSSVHCLVVLVRFGLVSGLAFNNNNNICVDTYAAQTKPARARLIHQILDIFYLKIT